ncbi:U5 small nuclear ribonucleoprotein 40 kDa protein-like [Hydractinia symbiolongicarpus]|uniref:U5 small nuclear ribonucleoprotein 40 kDa protein-like n=1 Tax=Hydractinia symbiolongicarpus TaxID=13093 RepID=UPI00254C4569|nr:U5 small nuclear ribonucleoprotein 40 kDa protein-like [Hydractinia symbiolongicarpus]
MADFGSGTKRRYDFGGDILEATGGGQLVPVKKQKNEIEVLNEQQKSLAAVSRSSSLQAPIMLLTGHEGEIFCSRFHPSGKTLASAGFDRQIYLWNVYGDCENFAVLKGHAGAILDMHYTPDGDTLVTCSSDKTIALWNYDTGAKIKKFKGHSSFVNSCCPARRGPELVVSGSDDCTVKLWDRRKKTAVQTFQNTYQVTAVCFNDNSSQIMSAGIDNLIKVWDLRKNDVLFSMSGHTDSVTGFRLSPDGSFLLSNSMDNTVRIWDIRPFAPVERCLKLFMGAHHNFEKNLLKCTWSPDGRYVASGSADRFVYVWDTVTRKILYKLPGHNGSVNDVDFHPDEPILMSCGSDRKIYLGELFVG